MPPAQDALKNSTLSSLTGLIGLQLFSRLFTFTLNQALVRMTSPEIFGAAVIQFDLILSTILFLSREGVRTTILRAKAPGPRSMNLTFIPIVTGIPLASVIAYFYERYATDELRLGPYFRDTVAVYALAAVVELFTEPFHNSSMVRLKTNVRVRAEGSGIIAKSIVAFLVLLYDTKRGDGQRKLALLAFALGQLAYSLVCLVVYLIHFGMKTLKPQVDRNKVSAFVDPQLLRLSATMTGQSIIKHVLTESDKLIISWISPLQDQGGYALAANYGSLIARIIFQPIEEVMRLYFSKIFAQESKRDAALRDAANALMSLVWVQLELSLFFLVFGTLYLPIILPILLPPRYMATSAPQILSAWVWYIPILALNGGLEGFVASVGTPRDVNRQSRWMVMFSLLFIAASAVFYRLGLGDASLVYANIVNLLARITFCALFAKSFCTTKEAVNLISFRQVLPSLRIIMVSLAAWALVKFDARSREIIVTSGRMALLDKNIVQHIGIGSALAVVWLSYWWISSGQKLRSTLMIGR